MEDYHIVNLIFGAEKKGCSAALQQCISRYATQGGKILMSGSYLGTLFPASFSERVLKFSYGGSMLGYTTGHIHGANTQLTIPTQANPNTYAVPAPDCLQPTDKAYTAFI